MTSNSIINWVFDGCVELLLWLGGLFGISYRAVNVWIFCVIWPAFTLALLLIIYRQRRKIRLLTKDRS